MVRTRPRHWFAALRRDARLFAVLVVAAITLQVVQPLAAASASASAGHLIICTFAGADEGQGAPQHDGCGDCIAGACGIHAPARLGGGTVLAWDHRNDAAAPAQALDERDHASFMDTGGPPGIRAPPFVA